MDQFLAKIPKATLVFILLTGGIFLIVLSDPPKTICDAQKEKFLGETKKLLFGKSNIPKPEDSTLYKELFETCRSNASPGGCYELFFQLRQLSKSMSSVEPNCRSKIAGIPQLKNALWESAELMIRLAWGEKPPVNYHTKMGWLKYAEINLFCEQKRLMESIYGSRPWQEFQEEMMASLPGSDQMPRETVWNRTIISLECANFR